MSGIITKATISVTLAVMFITMVLALMVALGADYGRNVDSAYTEQFVDVNTDIQAIQAEAIEIQQGSSIDADSSDIAQLEGVLSASDKTADIQNILKDTLIAIQNILPFGDFILNALLIVLAALMIGGVIYAFLGRWI